MREKFAEHLKKMGASPNTINGYLSDLKKANKNFITDYELSYLNLERIYAMEWKPNTQHRLRASIRKYAQFLVTQGKLEKVPEKLLTFDLPKITSSIPKVASVEQAKELMIKIDDKLVKLALSILHTTGCRISSLVGLKIEDVDKHITFHIAKGGKPYVSILTEETKKLLLDFVGTRTTGYIFVTENGLPMTTNNLRNHIKRVLGKSYINPHAFRHGFATSLLNKQLDIYSIKELMNHTSVATTERYLHLNPEALLNKINQDC